MTKCEAYENLKDYLDNVFHNSNDYETYCYLRDCADTLAPPAPDPDTGLAPCGCGGKAEIHTLMNDIIDPDMYNTHYIVCNECEISTETGCDSSKVIEDWNRAMGWKGGAK